MFISNIFVDDNIEIMMDGTILKLVNNHKHLGVVLSLNNKWSSHIDSIISSFSRQIPCLRIVKYKFSKEIFNKLYCTYIRPILEYACEVLDGCSQADSDRLKQVQLNAARIVTGLPTFSSLNSLYFETWLQTLAERRKYRKLNLMYRILNNDSSLYFQEL